MANVMVANPNTDPESSIVLLRRAQSGDDDALERLLGRYLPRLQRWASGRLPAGARTMLDTGDLVQDAVIGALKHLGAIEIRSESALLAYLRRAINNRIVDLYRRAARRPTREPLADDAPARDASPLEAAIGAEAVESYERALAALKDEEREAVVMSVELGLDYREIAAALGKPSVDAARMAVSRAIARLATEMRKVR